MKEQPKFSMGVQMVQMTWDNCPRNSWSTLNHAMRQSLYLAVGSQLEFCTDGIAFIQEHYRTTYWLGEAGWEQPYAFAIAVENRSFVEAFESWQGRVPFIANKVKPIDTNGFTHCEPTFRNRERLSLGSCVGSFLRRVTSICNEHVVICEYASHENRKPKSRMKLTHDQVREMFPAPKKPKRIQEPTQ